MADPADAPAPGLGPPELPPTPAAGSRAPLPLPKAPRARSANPGARREKAPSGPTTSLEDLVAWLGRMDLDPAAPDGEASAGEAQQSRETRKFRRTESAAAKLARASAAQAQEGSPASTGGVTEELPGETASSEDSGARIEDGARVVELSPRGGRRVRPPAASLFSSVAAQGVVLILMVLCYLLGRMTLPERAPAAAQSAAAAAGGKEPAGGSGARAQVMSVLDQALAAENKGDPQTAGKLLEPLRSGGEHIFGLDYELGLLAYRRGDYPGALPALNRSIAEGEEVGGSYDLRGVIATERRSDVGVNDFEASTQADPFQPNPFFHWGEALRRSGKPRAALMRLQQALDRAQTPAARTVYELKIRLTQVELGEQKFFAPALAAAMAQPLPAPEWLLTKAAQEMHGGDYAAAAATLERAWQVSGPAVLSSALRDYFFLGYADKPQLAGVYAKIFGRPLTAGPAVTPGVPVFAIPPPLADPAANRQSN